MLIGQYAIVQEFGQESQGLFFLGFLRPVWLGYFRGWLVQFCNVWDQVEKLPAWDNRSRNEDQSPSGPGSLFQGDNFRESYSWELVPRISRGCRGKLPEVPSRLRKGLVSDSFTEVPWRWGWGGWLTEPECLHAPRSGETQLTFWRDPIFVRASRQTAVMRVKPSYVAGSITPGGWTLALSLFCSWGI